MPPAPMQQPATVTNATRHSGRYSAAISSAPPRNAGNDETPCSDFVTIEGTLNEHTRITIYVSSDAMDCASMNANVTSSP